MSEIESGIRNKHITKYLDHYINSKINFEHAILLKGKWGSGKTFFIKEYIKNKKKNDEKEEMFYISLNGIEKLNDIYRLVVEEKYSIGKKTRVLFGGLKALNSLAKAVNVDFSKVKDDFKVEDLLKIDDKTTFIFDDIERVSSKILTSDLFGFIFREFIEKGNSKVILLSNDEELSKDDNYVKIKEKLIGKTLEVESDFESAFSIFIKGIDSKNFLDEHRGMIFQIYETSSYNNLRLLKQSIYDFDSFYFILSNQIKESNASMENLLFTFLMFSIEYKKGNIIDFEKFYFDVDSIINQYTENKTKVKQTFENLLKEKYVVLMNNLEHKNYNIDYEINWSNIIEKGIYDKSSVLILSQLKNEKLWFKLYENTASSDEEFEYNVNSTIEILKNRDEISEIKEFDELRHIFSIFLWGFKNKLSVFVNGENSKKEIIQLFEKYVDFMFDSGVLNSGKVVSVTNQSAYGASFYEYKEKEFEAFSLYIKLKSKDKELTIIENNINKLIDNLNEDHLNKLLYLLNPIFEKDNNYYNIPVLKNIEANTFFEIIIIPNNREKLLGLLFRRYQKLPKELKIELPFFKNIVELLKAEIKIKKKEGKLSAIMLSYNMEKFENIIKAYETQE